MREWLEIVIHGPDKSSEKGSLAEGKATGVVLDNPGTLDFQQIAVLHVAGITEGFLSTLGIQFLSALYRGIQSAPNSGVIVAREGATVLGFVAYTRDTGAMYRWILTHRSVPLLWALLPSLLRFSIYHRCAETLLYPFRRRSNEASGEPCSGPEPELLSIAVSERARGRGVGRLLVFALEEQFRSMGIKSYQVVTSAEDPRSNAFYRACGFSESRRFFNHGKLMQEYHRTLNADCPPSTTGQDQHGQTDPRCRT